jgi:hypothetical protein
LLVKQRAAGERPGALDGAQKGVLVHFSLDFVCKALQLQLHQELTENWRSSRGSTGNDGRPLCRQFVFEHLWQLPPLSKLGTKEKQYQGKFHSIQTSEEYELLFFTFR